MANGRYFLAEQAVCEWECRPSWRVWEIDWGDWRSSFLESPEDQRPMWQSTGEIGLAAKQLADGNSAAVRRAAGGIRFTYTYDEAGRIKSVENPQSDRTTYAYDSAGRRTTIQRANGTSSTYTYDAASQVTGLTHLSSTGLYLARYTYTYDNAGNPTKVNEIGATVTWGYDNANQLTSEVRDSAGVVQYADTMTYDAVGNRATLFDVTGARTTYTYDDANQLSTSVKGTTRTTFTYDANGNLEVEHVGTTRTTHTWDDENRLTQVAKTGMTTNVYTFNGDGQRVQIVDSQGTKKPIWDLENILLETDGSNVTQVVYTLEPAGYGNLVSQRRGSTTSFYHFDRLGSTRKLTSSVSAITDSYDFRAYGETFASSGSTVNVFRWVGMLGYYYDLDRLAYYLRARPYSPQLARFLSMDPITFLWHPDAKYCHGNPMIYVDQTGKFAVQIGCCLGCAIWIGSTIDACLRWPCRKNQTPACVIDCISQIFQQLNRGDQILVAGECSVCSLFLLRQLVRAGNRWCAAHFDLCKEVLEALDKILE
ncbi:MAG: RHS repeat-associated core domain-containing protein [Pirellulales bacterium]